MEGDLIECLNAGDGSWWTGRLRRDRRMVGLFPSNFVQVLGDDFVPGSRSVSPMPPGWSDTPGRTSSSAAATPQKQKTVFRKPFQGYKEAAGPSEVLRQRKQAASPPPQRPQPTNSVSRTNGSQAVAQRPQQQPLTRAPSRNPSPPQPRPVSRAPSPNPPPARSEPSPPPPPPPPHRIAVRSQQGPPRPTPSPIPESRPTNHAYPVPSRTPSPRPPSPSHQDNTPSPLRDAMEGVMSSLQDMGLPQDAPSPEPRRAPSPCAPWSPDTIGHYLDRDKPEQTNRPMTSLGLGGGHHVEDDDQAYEHQHNFPDRYDDGPPQLGNYVQRMESRLRQMHEQEQENNDPSDLHFTPDDAVPPAPPPKKPQHRYNQSIPPQRPSLRKRKSAYEPSEDLLDRTDTTKSSTTNSSSGFQSTATNSSASTGATSQSLMSGPSIGGFSATSAGSFAKRGKPSNLSNGRPSTAIDYNSSSGPVDYGRGASQDTRPNTPLAAAPYCSDLDSPRQAGPSSRGSVDCNGSADPASVFGGLTTPKSKKTGFLKKILESAKTGAATARSSMGTSSRPGSASPTKGITSETISSSSPPKHGKSATTDMGLGVNDWVQVRRDVNRATSPSHNELVERAERCQMMDCPVIYAVEELYESAEGDEGIDGLPVTQPTNFDVANLQLVDKSARFVNSLPPMTNPTSLAHGYVCRPHRSDAQRLRAIFTWVGEKVAWDEDIEGGDIDLKRVIQLKRGCPQEVAALVMEMCRAVGIHAEIVQGFLKTPGEQVEVDCLSRPNHWWNAVLVDGEWRMMDCSLASPTHPKRSFYSSANSHVAESWYFLARPMEICYTHIPLQADLQHICPPISPDVLLALPATCPAFFKNGLSVPNYDTSLVRINGLEIVQVRVHVPADVECVAEVEAIACARDADGDFYESGDVIRKRALSQPDWIRGQKRFTIKGLLPSDEGQGVLKVYAGKKGLMHSGRDITHPLVFALPIIHAGENPPYEFLIRHPTPHAQRHDLYVIQPQCGKLAINNTYVFAVRQRASSAPASSSFNASENNGRVSPNPFARPSSALSMGSSVAAVSTSSSGASSTPSLVSTKQTSGVREKPAKLAVQTPSGKILRLTRKADHMITTSTTSSDSQHDGTPDGSVWETVIKVSEGGVWRGLVLADRSARWCVWGEWECY